MDATIKPLGHFAAVCIFSLAGLILTAMAVTLVAFENVALILTVAE